MDFHGMDRVGCLLGVLDFGVGCEEISTDLMLYFWSLA